MIISLGLVRYAVPRDLKLTDEWLTEPGRRSARYGSRSILFRLPASHFYGSSECCATAWESLKINSSRLYFSGAACSLAPRFQELPDARESVGIRSLSSGANIHR